MNRKIKKVWFVVAIIMAIGVMVWWWQFRTPSFEPTKTISLDTNNNYFKDIENSIFSECGNIEKYKESGWYNNFVSEIEKLNYYILYDAEKIYSKNQSRFNSVEEIIDLGGGEIAKKI